MRTVVKITLTICFSELLDSLLTTDPITNLSLTGPAWTPLSPHSVLTFPNHFLAFLTFLLRQWTLGTTVQYSRFRHHTHTVVKVGCRRWRNCKPWWARSYNRGLGLEAEPQRVQGQSSCLSGAKPPEDESLVARPRPTQGYSWAHFSVPAKVPELSSTAFRSVFKTDLEIGGIFQQWEVVGG